MTMTLISTVTLASPAEVVFSSIPQIYTDLLLVYSGRSANASFSTVRIYFNGNTTGYTTKRLGGNGSTASSSDESYYLGELPGVAQTANTFGSYQMYIPNYTGATNKVYSSDGVSENNAASSYQSMSGGIWANTAAITSLNINNGTTNSVASLYGITKGSGGATVA